jgi:Beta-lactamase class C and other penicillin binding proteins
MEKSPCLEALGYRDREAGAQMATDTIFRIASMTKPFTSVATMMLAEEGKLLIADPVARYIPEFTDLKVAVDSDDASVKTLKTEPMRRGMTVQDLLRHTSGLTYSHLAGPLIKQAYESANVVDEKQSNAEMAAKLGRLPLAYQPGTTWQYGMSTDVLGRVVEVAGGMELDRFITERICTPLGLADTQFGPIDAARSAQPQIRSRLRQAPADAQHDRPAELDLRRQRAAIDRERLCPFLPDAAQRRRVRRHAFAFADDRRTHGIGSSGARNPP